ncbi:MAG: cold shock domain-containing protein [Planctomycetes bacterium]|nr:cold shock domain-containing protein [Planctomycetota bacterium]
MPTGTVKWFNNTKGWGFLKGDDGVELFAHYSDVAGDGFRSLSAGEKVQYEVEQGPKGAKAVKITRLEQEGSG